MPDLERWTDEELESLASLRILDDDWLDRLSDADLERMARGERVPGFDYSRPLPKADPEASKEMDRILRRVDERLRREDARGVKCEA